MPRWTPAQRFRPTGSAWPCLPSIPRCEIQPRTLDLAALAPLDGAVAVWTLADTAQAGERDAANSWREPDRIRTQPGKATLAHGRMAYKFPRFP